MNCCRWWYCHRYWAWLNKNRKYIAFWAFMYYYLHIPFCRQKCPYCKFALTPVFDEFKKKRYIEHLKKEIREEFKMQDARFQIQEPEKNKYISQWQKPKTIYFGWGTPSVLSLEEVGEVLECFPFYNQKKQSKISRRPQIQDSALMTKAQESSIEITFECNPEDITIEYVVWLFLLGINRVSLGVQSLNNETLRAIHRSDEQNILSALNSVQSAILSSWGTKDLLRKFQTEADSSYHQNDKRYWVSINIDFILGLPHVQKWETLKNIKTLHESYPFIAHTSVYILEKWLYPKSWKNHTLSDADLQDEFLGIIQYFEDIWWNHYEFSNWARPGYESKHNQSYWNHSNTRGFWLSAASYIDGMRYSNSESFSGYYKWQRIWEELLTSEQIALEELMFWLRTSRGFDINNPFMQLNQEKIQEFASKWLIISEKNNIKLTKTWIFLIDHIMGELIS